MKWRLVLAPKVETALRDLSPRIKRNIRACLEELCQDPHAGKALKDDLAGFYSFRVKRFRIVYRIEYYLITIVVVGLGRREGVYEELIGELRRKG